MRVSTRRARGVVVLIVGLALVFTACGCSDEGGDALELTTTSPEPATIEPTTTTGPTATEAVEAVLLHLTFDGESCTYEGPTELTPGPVELRFYNESETGAAVNFLQLLEGKTYQDVIEHTGPEPSTKHAPSWARELGSWSTTLAGGGSNWKGDLEPASYFMVCARVFPLAVWLRTGLTVKG